MPPLDPNTGGDATAAPSFEEFLAADPGTPSFEQFLRANPGGPAPQSFESFLKKSPGPPAPQSFEDFLASEPNAAARMRQVAIPHELRGYTADELAAPGSFINPRTGQRSTVAQDLARVPIFDSTVTGSTEALDGAAQMTRPDAADQWRGAGHVALGAVNVLSPALVGLGVAAPGEALAWYGISKGVGTGAQASAEALGASKEDAAEIGNVAQAAPLLYGAFDIGSDAFAAQKAATKASIENFYENAANNRPGAQTVELPGDSEPVALGGEDRIPVKLKNSSPLQAALRGQNPFGPVDAHIEFQGLMPNADGDPIFRVVDATGKVRTSGTARDVSEWLGFNAVDQSWIDKLRTAARASDLSGDQPITSTGAKGDLIKTERILNEHGNPTLRQIAGPEAETPGGGGQTQYVIDPTTGKLRLEQTSEPEPELTAEQSGEGEEELEALEGEEAGKPAETSTTTLESESTHELGRRGESGVSGAGAASARQSSGEETSVAVPGETQSIGARYAVRDLSDLQPSHNGQTFLPNAQYAHHNERDYSKAENQQRIIEQSSEERFDPRYLITDNPDATNGPPVIDDEGNVLGGNSRAMTMQLVYGRNGQAADAYRALLQKKAAQFGIDPATLSDYQQPVLVRVAGANDLAALPGASKWAIRKTNVSGTAALSGSEQATADAGQMTPDMKADIAQAIEEAGPGATLNDALTGKGGTALANRLIAQGFFSEQERPRLMDGKTGALTQNAKDRISKALLGQFFSDSDQYQRFPASIKQKLERVAAPLATVAGDRDWDLLPHVREAVNLLEYADAHGIKNLSDVVAQRDMFGGEKSPWSPEAITLAEHLKNSKPNDVVAAFRRYVASKEPTMFGESTPHEAFRDAFAGERADDLASRVHEVYENAERDFGPHRSFFSRALKAPSRGHIEDYQTPAELFRDVDARFQARSADRPGVVWLNRPGAEALRQALDPNELAFTGVHLDASDAGVVEAVEREIARLPVHELDARAGLQTLADALRTAFRRDSDVLGVVARENEGPRRLDETVKTRRHEGFHRAMDSLAIDHQAFTADPLVRTGLDRLARNPQYLKRGKLPKWSEVPTLIAAGQWQRLGYDLDQAVKVFAKYLDLLEAKHGAAGVDRALEAAHHQIRSEIRGRLRGQQLGHGSVRPLQRGGEEPDTAAPPGESLPGGRRESSARGAGETGEAESGRSTEASERPGRSNLNLFGSDENERVAETAARDRDQLQGERLTAQLNAPLTREEQLKKLKRSKEQPQSSLFEENEKPPQGSLFLGSGLGAMQPYVERFLKRDVTPTAKQVIELLKLSKGDIRTVLAPASRGPLAKGASLIVRHYAAELQRATDRAAAALEVARKFFDRQAEKFNFDFIDRMERGQKQPTPELDQIADAIREILDARRDAIRALGTGRLRAFLENYFPHIWKKPELAEELRANWAKRPIQGSKSFLKQRKLETVADGIAAGLEPISTNPVELVLDKAREMDKFLYGSMILQELKEQGLLQYVDAREGRVPPGWQKIEDPAAIVYGQSIQHITEYPNEGLYTGLQKVADALQIKHERGFLPLRGAVGRANQRTGQVSTLHGSAEDVLAHEIGHQIDWRAGSGKRFIEEYPDAQTVARLKRARKALKDTTQSTLDERRAARKELEALAPAIQQRKAFAKELRDLADLRGGEQAYTHKREEKMAQLAEMWVGARELFERTAPTVFKEWKQFLDQNPKLHALRDIEGNTEVTPIAQPYDVGGLVIKGHWYAPEPAARIVNNYLSPGLREKFGSVRAVMGASYFLNQVQLGFSGFHAVFTSLESVSSKLALAFYQIAHGDVGQALKSAALAPAAPILTFRKGLGMEKEWYAPGTQGALLEGLVNSMVQAGGRAHMDSFYQTHVAAKMMTAWRQGNVLGALLRAPAAAFEVPTRLIMEGLVPRLKMGAFADMAQYELARLGPNASAEEVQAALAKAWDSIDNRFGQLVYDNLFWHKYTKDIALMTVRSPGWNVGDIRELGGGLVDAAKFVGGSAGAGGKAIRMKLKGGVYQPVRFGEFTHRMAYWPAHLLVSATVGALLYYLWHGRAPQHLKDYFFPKDTHGHRWSPATYVRDEWNWSHEPAKTAAGKVNPLLRLATEILRNRDWREKPIMNPHHRWPREMKELAEYVAKQYMPIWGEQVGSSHSLDEKLLPEAGITRAPKSVDQQHR